MSPKHQLDEIQVPSQCAADWDTMVGNKQVRFCEHCNLSVHNLSAMTRQRALRLVANSRGRLCVRFVHSGDGRPITSLPPRLHSIGKRVSRITAGTFTAALSLSAAAAQSGTDTIRSLPGSEQTMPILEQKPPVEAMSASITGTISAGKDKPLAGAIVKLTNQVTGVELITSASEGGFYSFPAVGPGTYTLGARLNGYLDVDIEGITLRDNSNQHRDLRLSASTREEMLFVREETIMVTSGMAAMRAPGEPLVQAAYKNDLTAVRDLLLLGGDANGFDKATQTTALEHAVEHGNREMVQLLLGSNANVNGGEKRRGALMSLRDNATPELVLDLVAAGALVNQQDEAGDTPLMNAASSSNLNTVTMLLKMGATISVSDTTGETPLMKAAANDDPNVIKLLVDTGADVNARDQKGNTALLLAASTNKPAAIKLLLNAGAAVDVADGDGKTPLLAAATEENTEVLTLLIEAKADLNAQDKDGQTALMAAASEAPFEVVKLLVDKGAKLELRDKDGRTALMRAAIAGDAESTSLLLDAGADFRLRDKEEKNVLRLARDWDRPEVVKLLLARGITD